MWKFLARIILRNRILILSIVALITAFMAYRTTKLNMKYEYAALLPETDSAYINFEKFKETFGEDATMVVIGFVDSNFFDLEKIKDWKALQDSLKNIEGVLNVLTPVNSYNIEKDTAQKQFIANKIFDPLPENQKQLDSLKNIFLNLPFYKDILYAESSNLYGIILSWDKNVINKKKREHLMNEMELYAKNYSEKYNLEMHISGLPYTRTRISTMIKRELVMFSIIAILITAIILYLFFRSFKVVFFAMLIVAQGVIWALGSMTLFGYEITVLTGMIPPLLIVIGIPNSVYLLNKYHHEYKLHGNKVLALHRVIFKVGKATFLTNLTTAAGFATFIITSNTFLIEFGVIASLNIFGVFILSIALIPIVFSFLPPPKTRHTKHLDNKRIHYIVDKLCYLTQYKRKWIYTLVFVLVALGVVGLTLIKNEGYIVDDIPHKHPVYKDLKFFEKHLGGIMPIEISVDTKKPKGVLKMRTLKKIDEFQDSLKNYSDLSKSSSIADAIKFTKQAYYNGNPKYYKLPSNQEMNFIGAYLKSQDDKQNFLNSIVDSSFQKTRISLRVGDIGTERMRGLTDSIQKDIDAVFPKKLYDVKLTGSSVIFTKGTLNLINNLMVSLALAIVLISIFMASMFKSWRMVMVSLLPNLLPLLITAAIMGYFYIRLKPSTILVFSIAFGISVDNAIHFLAKYRQELTTSNWNIKQSVINALQETGVSIIYTAIILLFGFGMFVMSEFGGTISLGLLVGITLFLAMFANLLLLPSLLLSYEKSITTKRFTDLISNDEEFDGDKLKLDMKSKQ